MSEPGAEPRGRDLRGLLFSIAYDMLGTVADAEDIVLEAFLRLHRVERGGGVVESASGIPDDGHGAACDRPAASARARRQRYFGPWLPEPLPIESGPDPVELAETADSLALWFLVLLERSAPVERAAFLMREVFDYEYAEIGEIIRRTRRPAGRSARGLGSGSSRASHASAPTGQSSMSSPHGSWPRFQATVVEGGARLSGSSKYIVSFSRGEATTGTPRRFLVYRRVQPAA
jgi:hypothetical protein